MNPVTHRNFRIFGWQRSGVHRLPSLAFIGCVGLAFGVSFWNRDLRWADAASRWCLVFGVGYAALGSVDFVLLAHGNSRRRLGYLALQFAFLGGIVWTGRLAGEVSICLFPLVAVCIALLPPWPAAAAVASIYGGILAIERHFYGPHRMAGWAVSLLPGFGFVIAFTLLALKANAARVKALAMGAELERAAVVEERNRLAREIHDGIGHYLTTIHVQLQAARAVHASDPERALRAVAQAESLTRDALAEVRRSVGALEPDLPVEPLHRRLADLAAAADGWSASVSLRVIGEVRSVRPQLEHAIFRAAQEALTNVRKHACARSAALTLDYRDPTRLGLEVTDDGRGAGPATGGSGLGGLTERLGALGGTVTGRNAPGGGFVFRAEVPT